MAQEIESSLGAMQYEVEELTVRAQEERKELDEELERLTNLVLMFQAQISEVLPGVAHSTAE